VVDIWVGLRVLVPPRSRVIWKAIDLKAVPVGVVEFGGSIEASTLWVDADTNGDDVDVAALLA